MVNFNELTRDQLIQASQNYPWFAAARVSLCECFASESGLETADAFLKESLAYLPDATFVYSRLRRDIERDYTDEDIARAVRDAIGGKKRVFTAGMDFFSKEDYDSVRMDDDASLSQIAVVDYSAPAPEPVRTEVETFDLVTETLAQIYADQGYFDKAKEIYSKLCLLNPEKSAYFVSLIEKLNS